MLMPTCRATDAKIFPAAATFVALVAVLALSSACQSKHSGSQAAPSAPQLHVYGLSPNEPVAPECKKYAESLLRCVSDPRFPGDTKQAQTSALAQMMERMKFVDIPAAERAQAIAGAADECRDALSTLELSSKVACPGVL